MSAGVFEELNKSIRSLPHFYKAFHVNELEEHMPLSAFSPHSQLQMCPTKGFTNLCS